MKVTGLETIRLAEFPAILFLQVHTDEGLIGLGENCVGVESVETFLHESVAPRLLGKNPLNINEIHEVLHQDFIGFNGSSIAVRATSSIDIALWDLFGQATGQPIYQLLGGKVRDKIRAYNTCAGSAYAKGSSNIDRNRKAQLGTVTDHEYEDLFAFLNNPEDLVASLKAMGMTAMKIWPFDEAAIRSGGQTIHKKDLWEAVDLFKRARVAAGDDFDIMLEMHSLWSTPAATIIANAVEEYSPFWFEDPIRNESTDALIRLKNSINLPITVGETTGTRWDHHRLLSSKAVDHLMLDPGWVGGITEASKVIALASTYGVPVAPHDCTGPVSLAACTHLVLSQKNGIIQETVRAFLNTWYSDFTTGMPPIKDGRISVTRDPGHGVLLNPELLKSDRIVRRESVA